MMNRTHVEALLSRVKAGGRLVVVLRGVSGSGKSTLAKKLLDAAPGRAGAHRRASHPAGLAVAAQ
jgi:ABC-type bacteriocin/lantibiotic exporter with double-glycine peptidase domain